VAATLPSPAFVPVPLRATPRFRRIHARCEGGGSWLLYSDGPAEAPKVIRAEVIEDVFGVGTYATLTLRDHWAMIEAGWFVGDDLHQPVPLGDDTYDVWRGYYHPVTEAHDILYDLFVPRCGLMRWGGILPNGLDLRVHPSTPRYATARVNHELDLLRCVLDVEGSSDLVEIVLPEELKPLRDEYSDPVMEDILMSRVRNPNRGFSENGYQKAHRAKMEQERAVAAMTASR
jgi:hypothetical protein